MTVKPAVSGFTRWSAETLERCLDECERQLGPDIGLDADHY